MDVRDTFDHMVDELVEAARNWQASYEKRQCAAQSNNGRKRSKCWYALGVDEGRIQGLCIMMRVSAHCIPQVRLEEVYVELEKGLKEAVGSLHVEKKTNKYRKPVLRAYQDLLCTIKKILRENQHPQEAFFQ